MKEGGGRGREREGEGGRGREREREGERGREREGEGERGRERGGEGERGRERVGRREGKSGRHVHEGGIEKSQMQLAKQVLPNTYLDVISHRPTFGQEFDSAPPSHA